MFAAAISALFLMLFAVAACGDDDGPEETTDPPPKTERDAYTKWYVQQALDRYEETSRQATIDYYNNEAGADDQWYLFIIDADSGHLVTHATIPSRIGSNAAARVDISGYAYGADLVATGEEGQWVDYVFFNPQTDNGGTKHTWAIRRDNLIFASGWYEDSYPSPAPTKAEPGSYTQSFVEDAVWFYESNGKAALIEHFNDPASTDPASVDDQWYGFVSDLEGLLLAHPTVPDNVGKTFHEVLGTTPEGLASAEEMVTATETGRWVDYNYINPQSGEWETKHTWIVKRDDILIGSGWYEAGS